MRRGILRGSTARHGTHSEEAVELLPQSGRPLNIGGISDEDDNSDSPFYHETESNRPAIGLGLDEDVDDAGGISKGTLDPVYEAKARVLNHAIQDIGMGWYQWQLFVVIGFGWASDNLWPIITSLIIPPITNEFNPPRPPLLTLAQNIGLLIGAMFWGFGCDIFGRKLGFNLTLGVTALFGILAATSPNFAVLGCFAALWSFGVGGNLPVDSAIFLEFLPGSHQYLLTVLSLGWAIAQVVGNLVAWPLLGYHTCQEGEPCTREKNMGWRYFVICMGGMALLMFVTRFVFFTIHESPKYLMGKGRDGEAVRTVHEVARINGKVTGLTIKDLKACEPPGYVAQTDTTAAMKRTLASFDPSHVRALFATKQLAFSTTLIMTIWAFTGLAYPLYNSFLPYIQELRGIQFGDGSTHVTFRNSLIIAVLGVPGALLGGALVENKHLGRKGSLASSTVLTGVFLYGSTTAVTSGGLLSWNCAFSFSSNIMYAVLYAYTPETFPTCHRGTGNALTATSNRVFGILAPIIAMYANLQTAGPVYIAVVLFISAGFMCLILPYESRGKASL